MVMVYMAGDDNLDDAAVRDIVDEPSLGIAPLIVEDIFKILLALNAQNIPILLIEQNAKAVLKIVHRVYVLETGSMNMEERASDLLENEHVLSAYPGGLRDNFSFFPSNDICCGPAVLV
jgi:ABC-type lipopolysaccharide export system ATPase subunit